LADPDPDDLSALSETDWVWYNSQPLPPPRPDAGPPIVIDPPAQEDEDTPPLPPDAPRARQIRMLIVWAQARHDYLAGDTAETVCERYDLALSTLRYRAAREGWRRIDRRETGLADHLPPDVAQATLARSTLSGADAGDEAADVDAADLAGQTLKRVRRALANGRPGEAGSWMRLHEKLNRLVPPPPAPAPPPTPARPVDPLHEINRINGDLRMLGFDLRRLNPDDVAQRKAFEIRMASLRARSLEMARRGGVDLESLGLAGDPDAAGFEERGSDLDS
jgi:hypothetical protein